MVGQRLNWVGLSIGDYVIKYLLGEGSFSWVFRALHSDGRTVRAFKVAKPADAVSDGGPTSCVPTQALMRSGESIVNVAPDTEQILCLQAKKLLLINDPGLISVDEMAQKKNGCFYRMPVATGRTLRDYLSSGPVPVDVLLEIALTMNRLLDKDGALEYHGDLKPENIMITPSGAVILDPGYVGPLDVQVNDEKLTGVNCMITTPMYYPRLDADDLFAFGLMIWEVACRQQLLSKPARAADFDRSVVSDELFESVMASERDNNFYLSAIMAAQPPALLRPGLPREIEEFILNAVRLKWSDDGKLQEAKGFANFSEVASALATLLSKKIRYI